MIVTGFSAAKAYISPFEATSSSVLLAVSAPSLYVMVCLALKAVISELATKIVPPHEPLWFWVVEAHSLLSGAISKSIG
jgi:hypothetical protein